MYIYIYMYIQGGYAPFRRSWSSNNNNSEQGGVEDLGGRLLGSILECFEGSKLEVWEVLLNSILDLVGVWEAKRPQGRGLESLGLAQGRLGTQKWTQHEPSLSQVGANLGPTWTQLETTWSQLGPKLGPDWLM